MAARCCKPCSSGPVQPTAQGWCHTNGMFHAGGKKKTLLHLLKNSNYIKVHCVVLEKKGKIFTDRFFAA